LKHGEGNVGPVASGESSSVSPPRPPAVPPSLPPLFPLYLFLKGGEGRVGEDDVAHGFVDLSAIIPNFRYGRPGLEVLGHVVPRHLGGQRKQGGREGGGKRWFETWKGLSGSHPPSHSLPERTSSTPVSKSDSKWPLMGSFKRPATRNLFT